MVDNLAPDMATQVNTNFMEQRIVESQTAFPSSKYQMPQSVENEMSDGTWFAKQQLMKPIQVAQLSWTTALARDTDLYAVSVPSVLGTQESLVLRTLRMYAFYKLSPCFRVQINSTQFHQGQLICTFDPFSISSRGTIDNYSIYSATGLPNVKIMASESDAVELCIPFVHPRSFLTTNAQSFNNLGTFRITVLNPLLSAEGASSSLTVTVWVYAKDAQVHVPIQDHDPVLEGDPVEATSFTGEIGKLGQNATSMVGNIVTGNFGQALRKGQGLIDNLGNLLGFDYPSRTVQPDKTISPIENLAVGIGRSQSQRLAIDPFSMHILNDDEASESKLAMDIKRLVKMPMLLTQFQFSAISAADSLLFSCPITPSLNPLLSDQGIQRHYLSYVSNAFLYWNGGLNYDVEVVATRFHSGKLLLAYVPNSQEIPTYVSAATSLPNVIIDLQQTSRSTFKVPYTSSTAMKNVNIRPNASAAEITDATIGTLVCYVQNTLAYASNVAPSVEINLYISAADDFNLYVPAKPYVNYVFTPPPPPEVEATSGIGINLNKNQNVIPSSVLSKDQNASIPRKHFGEDYSLIDIIRRFTPLDTISVVGSALSTYILPVVPYASDNPQDCYIGYFSRLYNCWSGSVRYKFVSFGNRGDNSSMSVVHVPSYNLEPNVLSDPQLTTGLASVRTNVCQDLALEVDVPYYSKYNMLLTRNRAGYPDIENNGFINLLFSNPTPDVPANIYTDLYIAAGEDFRFIYPRPPPMDLTNVGFTTTPL